MPELPEVETVRAGLLEIVKDQPVIRRVQLQRADIRFLIPKTLPIRLKGQKITGVRRRAKYLLIETPDVILLSHLGMTGSWRLAKPGSEDKHDHCYIEFEDGRRLAFRDPRRFGLLDLVDWGGESMHPRLKGLGPEPLDGAVFNSDYLFHMTRKRKTAIKVFIMDQRVVVGVGNIYASEALFRARIKPQRLAGKITLEEAERLVVAIRSILRSAIKAGGSSIRDFRQASGESGYFQTSHQVYEHGGDPCPVCEAMIRSELIGGRSTYWCPVCQKK